LPAGQSMRELLSRKQELLKRLSAADHA
jgi:hypothetical protein